MVLGRLQPKHAKPGQQQQQLAAPGRPVCVVAAATAVEPLAAAGQRHRARQSSSSSSSEGTASSSTHGPALFDRAPATRVAAATVGGSKKQQKCTLQAGDGWQIAQLIASAVTWQDLNHICSTHMKSLNTVHITAALSWLAKHVKPHQLDLNQQAGVQGLVMELLLPRLLARADKLSARGLANSIWALSTLRITPKPQQLEQLLWFTEAAATEMEPQQISSLLYALAQWQQQHAQPQQAQQQLWQQPKQWWQQQQLQLQLPHKAHSLWPQQQWSQQQWQYEWQQQQYGQHQTPSDNSWQRGSGKAGTGATDELGVSDGTQLQLTASHTAVAAAAASTPEQSSCITQPAINALLAAATDMLDYFSPQALSNTLYAAAVLSAMPSIQFQDAFWRASQQSMAAAQPQHLSNMAWAAARLGLQVPEMWRNSWLVMSYQSLHQATPQGCSNSLWAVAHLDWGNAVLCPVTQPAASSSSGNSSGSGSDDGSSNSWLGYYLLLSVPELERYSDQALSNAWWALGRIAQRQQQHQQLQCARQGAASQQQWQQQWQEQAMHQQQQQQQSLGQHFGGGGHVAQLAAAGVRSTLQRSKLQQLLVNTGWQQRCLAVLQPRLLGFNSQQLSNTIWGLATAGIHPPEAWLTCFVRASGPKLLGLKPQEMSCTLVALARLKHNPGKSWFALYEAALARQLSSCSSQTVSNSLWAMASLQHCPSRAFSQALLPAVVTRLQHCSAEAAANSSGGSSTISSGWAFTPQGLAMLLLSIAKIALQQQQQQSSGGMQSWLDALQSNDGIVDTDFLWHIVAKQLLGASEDGPSAAKPLAGFSPQGLASLAGAAALMQAGEAGGQLVLAVLHQLVLKQQQQQWQQHQQHGLVSTVVEQQQQHVHLADISMVLWTAARLQLQPPPHQLYLLVKHALREVQQLGHNYTNSSVVFSNGWLPATALCKDGYKVLGALMYALGSVGFHPGSAWFMQWFKATEPLLAGCNKWTLAMLLWGCVWLEEIPPAGWSKAWGRAWAQQQRRQQQLQSPHQRQRHPRWLMQHGLQWQLKAGQQDGQQQHLQQRQQQHSQQQQCIGNKVAAAAARQGLRMLVAAAEAEEDNEVAAVGEAEVEARPQLYRLCHWLLRNARQGNSQIKTW